MSTYLEANGTRYPILGDVSVALSFNNRGATASATIRIERGQDVPFAGALAGIFRNTGAAVTKLIGGLLEKQNLTIEPGKETVNVTFSPFRSYLRANLIINYKQNSNFAGHLEFARQLVNGQNLFLVAISSPPEISSDSFDFEFPLGTFEDFLQALCDLIGADWFIRANDWLQTPVPGSGPVATVIIMRRQLGVPMAQQDTLRFRLPGGPIASEDFNFIGSPSVSLQPPAASVFLILGKRGPQGLIRQINEITPVDAELIRVNQPVTDQVSYSIDIEDFDEINVVRVLDGAGNELARYQLSDESLVDLAEFPDGVVPTGKLAFRTDQKQLIFPDDDEPVNPKDMAGVITETYQLEITCTIYYGFAQAESAQAISYLAGQTNGRGDGRIFNVENRTDLLTSAQCQPIADEKAERLGRSLFSVDYQTHRDTYSIGQYQRVIYPSAQLNGAVLRIEEITANYKQDPAQDVYSIKLATFVPQPSVLKLNDLSKIAKAPKFGFKAAIGPAPGGGNNPAPGVCTCSWPGAETFLDGGFPPYIVGGFSGEISAINNTSLTSSLDDPVSLFTVRLARVGTDLNGNSIFRYQIAMFTATSHVVTYTGPDTGSNGAGYDNIADIRSDGAGNIYFRATTPVDGVPTQVIARFSSSDPLNIIPVLTGTAGSGVVGIIADIAPNEDGSLVYFIDVLADVEGGTAACVIKSTTTGGAVSEVSLSTGSPNFGQLDVNDSLANQHVNVRRLSVYRDANGNDLLFLAQSLQSAFAQFGQANEALIYCERIVDSNRSLRLLLGGGGESFETPGDGITKDISAQPVYELKANHCDNVMIELGFRRLVAELKRDSEPAFYKPLDVYNDETVDPPIRPISNEAKPFTISLRPTTSDGNIGDVYFIEDINALIRRVAAVGCAE